MSLLTEIVNEFHLFLEKDTSPPIFKELDCSYIKLSYDTEVKPAYPDYSKRRKFMILISRLIEKNEAKPHKDILKSGYAFYDAFKTIVNKCKDRIMRKKSIDDALGKEDINNLVMKYDYYFEGKVDQILSCIDSIKYITVFPDGRIVACHSECLTIWNGNNLEKVISIPKNFICKAKVIDSSKVVVSLEDIHLCVIDINTEKTIDIPVEPILSMRILPNKNILILSKNGIFIYDSSTGDCLHKIKVRLCALVILPPNHIAYALPDSTIKIYNYETGVDVKELWGYHTEPIHALLCIRNNKLVSFADDIIIWNVETEVPEKILYDKPPYIDNQLIIYPTQCNVKLYDNQGNYKLLTSYRQKVLPNNELISGISLYGNNFYLVINNLEENTSRMINQNVELWKVTPNGKIITSKENQIIIYR